MNCYFLMEGQKTEKQVYSAWMGYLFPGIQRRERLEDLQGNSYFMLAGHGYPFGERQINQAVMDVNRHGDIQHFFICVDAEDEDVEQKRLFITEQASRYKPLVQPVVVIANCCIETWFLGNQKMIVQDPALGSRLGRLRKNYDVMTLDPELMPKPENSLSARARFHYWYLVAAMKENGFFTLKVIRAW
ncbi:MAG: hypothetical protein HQM04_12025 [Magnetococcales bacterium]|nr:hypothetical protein [Magnetococcales bacterium]MBF0115751.1 hypothetical protein [Magnetococcales bacterium]